MMNIGMTKVMFDTGGVSTAPVKIKTVYLFDEDNSYRSINIEYTSMSDNPISGIRFAWYGVDAFNEPADMGGTIERGFGHGTIDHTLHPHETKTATFNMNSRDAKKVLQCWPDKVGFIDGTKWESTIVN